MKYTFKGHVKLIVNRHRSDDPLAENLNLIKFGVEDTGIGIERDQLEKVFEVFNDVGANSKVEPGSGLGLNISNQLAKLLTYKGGRGITI